MLPNSTRARVLLSKLKKRPRRLNPGTQAELIALARSWLADPIHDIIARASDFAIGDGHRRVEGLELLGETEADVTLLEGDISDLALDRMAFVSAFHRSPLGSVDQASIIRSMKESEPGITNKAIADEMHIDPSMPTRLLSLFDTAPEVQEAAQAGKIGVTHWYAISKAADQLAALKSALNGSSRDDLHVRTANSETATATPHPPSLRVRPKPRPAPSPSSPTMAASPSLSPRRT